MPLTLKAVTYYDADSHLMELSDRLAIPTPTRHPAKLRPLYLGGAGQLAEDAVSRAEARCVIRRRSGARRGV